MAGKHKLVDNLYRVSLAAAAQVVDLVQTLDGGRRNMYDPDEIEEEQREREKRNKINQDFNQFVRRVQVRLGPWVEQVAERLHGGSQLSCAAAVASSVDGPEAWKSSNHWPWSLVLASKHVLSACAVCAPVVQEHWEREFPDLQLEFDIPFR